MQQTKGRSYIHRHYHWVVAGIIFLMVFTYGGTVNNLAGLHIAPVSKFLEISRAEFSVLSSSRTLLGMISTFLSGFLIERFGIRLGSGSGMLAGAAGYLILAQLKNKWMLMLGNALLGISAGLCSTAAAVYIARVWFHRHNGTILGVITAASGIGASVMCAIQTAAIEAIHFRASYFICAIALALIGILILLFIRNKPRDMGLMPLGYGEAESGTRSAKRDIGYVGYTMKELWMRPSFYLMLLCTVLSGVSCYMALTVVHPFVVDCGYSAAEAGTIQSMMMLLLTVVKLLAGYLNDHIGARKVFIACLLAAVAGLALLGLAQNYLLIGAAVVIYTCALPIVTLVTPLLAAELFGYRAQAQYTGILLSLISVASFLGEYLTNWIYDLCGTYSFSFFIGAAIAVVALLLLLVLHRLEKR